MEGDSGIYKKRSTNEVNETEDLPSRYHTGEFATKLKNAVQHGDLETVGTMLEDGDFFGFDINQPDMDDGTLLHWAAINGNVPMAELLLHRGSNINALAPKLRMTPLMWAVSKAQLDMTVMLLKKGADPKVKDSTGRDALHLAAVSESFPIVAYLVANGCDPTEPDSHGFTPIMLACFKLSGISIVRFLLSLTSNVQTGQDYLEGNTALHWAIYSEYWIAVSLLLKSGADIELRNYGGATGRGLIERKLNSTSGEFFLHRKVKKDLQVAITAKESLKSGYWKDWIRCRVTQIQGKGSGTELVWILLLVGVLAFFLEWDPIHWAFKFGLIPILILGLWLGHPKLTSRFPQQNLLQLSIMAKLMLYIFWGYKMIQFPSIHWGFTLALGLTSIGLWWNFLRAWLRDPGILRPTPENRNKMMMELIEEKRFDGANFCPSCMVRRPIRSKHCAQCNHCVARFDHHCEWIGNCVGARNHLNFVWYIIWKLLTGIVYLTGCLVIGLKIFENVDLAQIHVVIGHNLLLIILTLFVLVNSIWISGLISTQLYQIICLGVTTNEKINGGRYSYLTRRKGDAGGGETMDSTYEQNPSRDPSSNGPGYFANFVNFCNLACCPTYVKMDWTAAYSRPKRLPKFPRSIDDYFQQNKGLSKDYAVQISDMEGISNEDDDDEQSVEDVGSADLNDNQRDKLNQH